MSDSARPWVRLEYLEEFLEFHHELPVGLDEVISEVIFACVDTSTRYLEQVINHIYFLSLHDTKKCENFGLIYSCQNQLIRKVTTVSLVFTFG